MSKLNTAKSGFYITPTVRELANNEGCWWLIDIIRIGVMLTPQLRGVRSFWRIDGIADPVAERIVAWVVTATDGGIGDAPEVKLYEQRIEYSDIDDALLPLQLYCFPEPELEGDHYLIMLPEDY